MGFQLFRAIIAGFCLSILPLAAAFAQVMIGYTPTQIRRAQPQMPVYQAPVQSSAVSAPVAIQPVVSVSSVAQAPLTPKKTQKSAPVDFQADTLDYNEETRVITASGNVFLTQDNRILRADKVVYNLGADRVSAMGHVVLNEPNGDIHYAAQLILQDKFKEGVINRLTSELTDGSTFSAKTGHRISGVKTVMSDASYTACTLCKDDPDKAPIWQIKASEVTHDEENRSVSYKNAWFETYGIPVFYVPYFAHPDGSIDRKSGLLAPSAGYKSDYGFMMDNRYYWNIAPDQDATIGLRAFSEENPLLYTQWRKRWEDAEIQIDGGITYSDYTDSIGGVDYDQTDELRGHFLVHALWDMNEKWRSGADIQWASDDQYMNQYDFVDDDILVSDLYAERFDDRDYSAVHFLTFQDTRILDEPVDQPEIIPEIVSSFQGRPGAVPLVGGSWFTNTSYLGLRRNGDDEQDMDRLSLGGGWKRHFVSDYGLVSDLTLSARQDVYHVRDLETATPGSGLRTEASEVRLFPQAHWVNRYPLVNNRDGYQIKLEPIVALTAAPNIDVTDNIPNEDSQDVQLDADNLFNADRFPGLDRVEDQSRVTYGVSSGFYSSDKGDIVGFLGQSYRLQEDDNPFPEGSGLSGRSSDVVGSLEGGYGPYSMDYRFQLDSRHLTSNRHELDLGLNFDRFSLTSQYLFAKRLEGTEFDASREQGKLSAGYYWDKNWRTYGGFVQDFGENNGLRVIYSGLQYFGQCVSWQLVGARNYTDDSSGESDLEIVFRLGLKNLGEFERSQWHNQGNVNE